MWQGWQRHDAATVAAPTHAKVMADMGGLAWRVLGTGASVVAGIVANKTVTQIWRTAGKDSRVDPKNPHTPAGDAVALAIVSAVAAALAQTVLTRMAAAYYERSSGQLPAAMRPSTKTKSAKV